MAALLFTQLTVAQIEVLDQVVAIVDDDIILASELQERVQGVRATMESRGVEVPSDDVLIRETLDRLILDSIQLQLASRYGVRIPDQQLAEAMTRRTYIMSLMAMVFLPATFLTGLFGVNLGGIPGGSSPVGFLTFVSLLLSLVVGLGIWLRCHKWL